MSLDALPALLDRLAQGAPAPEDREALQTLTTSAPGHVTAHVALARVCELDGRPAEARASWKRARLLLPNSPAVQAGLRRTATPGGRAQPPSAPVASPEPSPAPAVSVPAAPSAEDADLDSLIEELEGARIEPTPNPDDVPTPDLDTGADGDVVSPTLARIYEAQGQFAEAARVHRRLAEKRPDEAAEHRRQAEALEARADAAAREESGGNPGRGSGGNDD